LKKGERGGFVFILKIPPCPSSAFDRPTGELWNNKQNITPWSKGPRGDVLTAYTPSSVPVPARGGIIPLVPMSPSGSSDRPETRLCLMKDKTRGRVSPLDEESFRFGLSPGGVCHPASLDTGSWALTPRFHPYLFSSRKTWAVCFLWHFPSGKNTNPRLPVRKRPTQHPVGCGARTFLWSHLRPSDPPAVANSRNSPLARILPLRSPLKKRGGRGNASNLRQKMLVIPAKAGI